MKDDQHTPSFTVVESRISIFPNGERPDFLNELEDGQSAIIISICPGETHVSIVNEVPRIKSSWTAVFGWSSLCGISILHQHERISMANPSQIAKALRGTLKRYGVSVDTNDFIMESRQRFRSALTYIMDETIGEGSEFDKIILSAPEWLVPALADSMSLRPHIEPEIQDI